MSCVKIYNCEVKNYDDDNGDFERNLQITGN